MLKYYNIKTKTLILPSDFNEEFKNIPNDSEIIIFEELGCAYEYSKFNQEIKENILPV